MRQIFVTPPVAPNAALAKVARLVQTDEVQFNVGYATDIGRKRSQNQDNVATFPELGLFIVADGMGGHKGGETASAISVEVIPEFVKNAIKQENWSPRVVITQAIEAANKAIHARAAEQPGLNGMGTTTTALLFKDGILTIGHVGDSRCYFFRPDAIWQATRDHSLVQEKLRAGLITRADVCNDKMKNVITRSVGFDEQVNVEVYEMKAIAGDVFLICSDGLSGLIEDKNILDLIQTHTFKEHDVKKAVTSLIDTANHNGGDDNITAVVVEVLGDG